MTEENIVDEQILQAASDPVEQAIESGDGSSPSMPKSDQAYNFRQLREKAERLEAEREEAFKRNAELQDQLLRHISGSQKQPEERDEFADLSPGDWITREQSERMAAKIAEQVARRAVEEDRAKRRVEDAPNRIRQRYNDFDEVVTEENVRTLKALEPDVAQALSMIQDEEAKAVAAYKYIKTVMPKAPSKTAVRKLEENATMPRSMSTVGGSSPLSDAARFENGLTPELKAHLQKEMREAARRS